MWQGCTLRIVSYEMSIRIVFSCDNMQRYNYFRYAQHYCSLQFHFLFDWSLFSLFSKRQYAILWGKERSMYEAGATILVFIFALWQGNKRCNPCYRIGVRYDRWEENGIVKIVENNGAIQSYRRKDRPQRTFSVYRGRCSMKYFLPYFSISIWRLKCSNYLTSRSCHLYFNIYMVYIQPIMYL